MKPLKKIKIKWSPSFSYGIGLLTTDGNLSKDGRHITFTSKDFELINNFQKSLGIRYPVSKKCSGSQKAKKYYFVCFGDVCLYKFLVQIGLMPRKSKIIKEVRVPNKYFFDFLRGHLDGDGSFYSYWDPRWRSSFMFYTVFLSASKKHIIWLQRKILKLVGIRGHINKSKLCYQLKYAKKESVKLLPKIYYQKEILYLKRKKEKIENVLLKTGVTL